MENKMNEITYKEVWNTLSSVDCSKHTDSKMGLTYLPWAWAWGILVEHYAHAQYSFAQEEYLDNGTVMVLCTIEIGHLKRQMFLPVMDHKNNSIANPTTRQISDARMRCLTKCMAMFGLGHYIYAGEELPNATVDKSEAKVKQTPKPKEDPKTKYGLVSANGEDLGIFTGETDLVKELRSRLGVAKDDIKDDHKAFFKVNFKTIQEASKNAVGDEHVALAKLLALYWENKD